MTIFTQKSLLGFGFILLVDNIYLKLNKKMYEPIIDSNEQINIIFAILAWIVIIVSIQLLVLSRPDLTESNVFIYGAYLGFSMYALYNCTNYALYPSKWNINIALGDTIWGSLLTGTTGYMMYNYF